MPLSYPMFVNMWWIQESACYMSCCPVPSVCFSLTFQSQARPLSSLTPLATFSLLSILHSSFFPTHSHEWYSPRERKKECKNSRERQRRGGSSHALSYFLNDGDQSGGAGRGEEGQIEVCEGRGRRARSSPDRLTLPPHWS